MVSGPGDVNDDGIQDIMITDVSTYLNKGNGYIVSYPLKVTSPPSFLPSSCPSRAPSQRPSSQPSSSLPTHCPTFNPDEMPSTSTRRPSMSRRPSSNPTSRIPTGIPTVTTMPTTSTRNPSFRPTIVQSQVLPSLTPSGSQTAFISSLPSPLPSSSLTPLSLSDYFVRLVNSSSLNSVGVVYGVEGRNEIFEISSISNDGKRKSGWSGTIIGGKGRKIYVIYTKDPSQPVNRIILQDFKSLSDVIDFSHISQITSLADISYLTNPLTLFLPDNQKIVISSYKTMSDLSDENFVFQSSSSSSTRSRNDVYIAIALFLPIILVTAWFVYFSVKREEQNDESKLKEEKEITPVQDELETRDDGAQERQDNDIRRDNLSEMNLGTDLFFSHMFERDSSDLISDESVLSSNEDNASFLFPRRQQPININRNEESVHSLSVGEIDTGSYMNRSLLSSEKDDDSLSVFFYTTNEHESFEELFY